MEEEPRDFLWEQAYIKELQKEGEKIGVTSSATIVDMVMRRLNRKNGQYGNSFRSRDILKEARNKAVDLVAYTLLEAQKRNSSQSDGHHYLFEAAKHAMLSEYYLRMSKRNE